MRLLHNCTDIKDMWPISVPDIIDSVQCVVTVFFFMVMKLFPWPPMSRWGMNIILGAPPQSRVASNCLSALSGGFNFLTKCSLAWRFYQNPPNEAQWLMVTHHWPTVNPSMHVCMWNSLSPRWNWDCVVYLGCASSWQLKCSPNHAASSPMVSQHLLSFGTSSLHVLFRRTISNQNRFNISRASCWMYTCTVWK